MTTPFTEPSLPVVGTESTVGDFWQWAYSDIISNDTRGAFAEYLVGLALDCLDEPRLSWDAVDLRYRGVGVEVKSSARWQSWPQDEPSRPEFGIAPTQAWDAKTNTHDNRKRRSADVYVFAYLNAYPATIEDLLNPLAWEFYVVSTVTLDERHPGQGKIALNRVRDLANLTGYDTLASTVRCLVEKVGPLGAAH